MKELPEPVGDARLARDGVDDETANANETTSGSDEVISSEDSCFMTFATPKASASAFCRAVVSRVVPDGLWGEDETRTWNKQLLLRKIDQFIAQGRYESMSLHDLLQGFKVCFDWLEGLEQPRLTSVRSTTFHGLYRPRRSINVGSLDRSFKSGLRSSPN